MRTSRFLGSALLALSLALTGCGSHQSTASSSASSSASQMSIQTAADTFGTADADSAQGFEIQTDSQWEPTRFHATWPHAKNKAFNDVLDEMIKDDKNNFTDSYNAASYKDAVAIPEFTVTWSSLINNDSLVGVRLISDDFGGTSHVRTFTTVYGSADGSEAWSGKDLIDAGQVDSLLKAVSDAAVQQSLRDPEEGTPDADSVLRDVAFASNGDLQIHAAKGELASADKNDVLVTIPAAQASQWLSDAGRRVQTAAQNVASPSGTASSSATTAQASASDTANSVDCTVEKCIALTFDDGPGPYTDQILDTLKSKDAKATFFTIGRNVVANPDTVKREVDMGMAVGDHTWSHPVLSSVSDDTAKTEISKTAEAIWNATGTAPVAVRPPYGAFAKSTPHEGLPFVLWDIDSEDWKNRNADITTKNIMSAAHPGGIVLMHDIHPSTAQALPGIIDQLQAQGYKLVTVPQLLDGNMTADGAYYSGDAPSS